MVGGSGRAGSVRGDGTRRISADGGDDAKGRG
jgi:hypothetical protein